MNHKTSNRPGLDTTESGGILVEASVVIVVLLLISTIILDINFAFREQGALRDASRLGARVAAGAPGDGFDAVEVQEYTRLAVASAIEAAGLTASDYHIDIWGIRRDFEGKPEHRVQVTVSRKTSGRFYLLPSGIFRACAGSTYFMESRRPIEDGGVVKTNPDCNPSGVTGGVVK